MWKQAPATLPTSPGYYFVRNHLKNRSGGRDAADFSSAGWLIGTFTLELDHKLEWYDETVPAFFEKDILDVAKAAFLIADKNLTKKNREKELKIFLKKKYKINLE